MAWFRFPWNLFRRPKAASPDQADEQPDTVVQPGASGRPAAGSPDPALRPLSWWQRLLAWWRRLWAAPPDARPAGTPGAAPDENKADLFDRIFTENVPLRLDSGALLAPGLERHIRVRGRDFWIMGLNDGIKGIGQQTVKGIAHAHATTLVEYVRASSRGRKQALESEMEVKKDIARDEEDRYRDAQEHLDEMTHQYHKHPRTFSALLFFFYLLIAVFLIIADIPLAMILTEKGFDLVPGSWASLLLTAGIALCAVYVKIYYDDYIATSLGHYNSQFDRIRKGKDKKRGKKPPAPADNRPETNEVQAEKKNDGTGQPDPESHTNKRVLNQAIAEYWVKWGVKTVILILTLYTIWVLGKFRYQNISEGERELLASFADWAQKNQLNVTLKSVFDTTLLAFRLITLIFPLIGGICLSLAITNLQNLWRFGKAKRAYRLRQKNYLKALGEYSLVKKQYEDFSGIYREWQDNDKDNDHVRYYAGVFESYYLLGYQNGFVVPDVFNPEADLYAQMEKMRRRLADRRIYTLLRREQTA